MNKLYLSITLFCAVITASAQQKITFTATDGLEVTADAYISSTSNPYIILMHQAGYSRGEYRDIAPKLANLGYNCIALDQRSGKEVNFVTNETAQRAAHKNLPQNYIDALSDIRGAIKYIKEQSSKPIILWGSSYSASLALVVAAEELKVNAVIVFSPGEYFPDKDYVKNSIKKLTIPVLALTSKPEKEKMEEVFTLMPKKNLTLFTPTTGIGTHGAKALWDNNPTSKEYWMQITQFFSQLKNK
ncbi:MAG: dienelactone hydrolase family protein [Bacteroidales bacterium]|nr:dienelactone hydrolase family protein [Bacteroidales bacterium]MBN2748331.1 dienelactone hydrolase family protein [Bacteroidales bacterium]